MRRRVTDEEEEKKIEIKREMRDGGQVLLHPFLDGRSKNHCGCLDISVWLYVCVGCTHVSLGIINHKLYRERKTDAAVGTLFCSSLPPASAAPGRKKRECGGRGGRESEGVNLIHVV